MITIFVRIFNQTPTKYDKPATIQNISKIAHEFISINFNRTHKVMNFFIYNATINKITV